MADASTLSGFAFAKLSGTGVLVPFKPSACDGFVVGLQFAPGASGVATVTRSTDGVTFAPLMAGSRVISQRSTTGKLYFYEAQPGTSWRVEYTLSSGNMFCNIWRTLGLNATPESGFMSVDGQSRCIPSPMSPAPAQLAQLYALRYTPLPDGDIAGTITGWKLVAGSAIVKLSIPSAARREKAYTFLLGSNRELWAEYADVVAVIDGTGKMIASAASRVAPSVTYRAGARISSGDQTANGLLFHSTLIEAATCHIEVVTDQSNPQNWTIPLPDLHALGV